MIRMPEVDQARLQSDLMALAEFRDIDSPGWTRRVFSEPYARSREWVAARMREAGLEVRRDTAGNLIGSIAGSGGPALATGSHTDSVAGGGRFDGPVGVLGAIEAARCIRESGHELRHELRVVDFLGEEPNDFGLSCVGSRAVAGTLTAEHLTTRDPGGRTLAEALESCGGDPRRIGEAAWMPGDIRAFMELHIEQGPVLERAGVPLGVVSGIAGIERVVATFSGQADHAGTTPMGARHDALCAAADVVLAIESLASRGDGGSVGTAGRIEVLPGALNVIPGHARLWAEFRSIDGAWLDSRRAALDEAILAASGKRGVEASLKLLSRTEPVITSDEVRTAMTEAIAALGLDCVLLPSGAGHDTVQMARLGPVGMLFVPSVGGRSHCPEELTSPEHLEAGVAALLATLLVLDAR
ncbi:MAG TPA: Zn-dependent hydrolase [Candidatus Dormibacteraeota bacterium]|nr:Zn-dependent hydrolase [Candidatus Dormibacteraeota bacterium]